MSGEITGLWFSDSNEFEKALNSYYPGGIKKYRALVSSEDNFIVVQASVSSPGFPLVFFKTENFNAVEKKEVIDFLKKQNIKIIKANSLRRNSQSQSFTISFKSSNNFIRALEILYLARKELRCRAIIPTKEGCLVIVPNKTTPRLNKLVLDGFSSMTEKEMEVIKAKINSLDIIKCDSLEELPETVNFQ